MGSERYDAHYCIVGGGPAGMPLALLLARAGVQIALIEEHEASSATSAATSGRSPT